MVIGIPFAALIAVAPIPPASWAAIHESVGNWEAALNSYLRWNDQQRASVSDFPVRIHRCIRYAAQFQRHRDAHFQSYVHSLKLADALNLYSDVIEKLARLYADVDRVTPAKLFQHGRDEFVRSLADPAFIARHLNGADEQSLQKMRTWLAQFHIPSAATQREIRVAVRDVAMGIRETVPNADAAAIVLEFLCGACRGLDEFTTFHPPGSLPKYTPGPTVVDATIFEERMGIGYIRITEFRETTSNEFDTVVGQLRMRGLRALVIDLRGNPGGLLTAGIEMARRLVPNGIIVRTTGQELTVANQTFVSESGMMAFELPVVLLIDDRTMSAAEVLAAAVKEHARGTLVGTQTFGKGTVQVPLKMSDGTKTKSAGVLTLTIARTMTPNGLAISGGVVPDIIERDVDVQLKSAIAQAITLASMERSKLPDR